MRGAKVTVCKCWNGGNDELHQGRELAVDLVEARPSPVPLDDGKGVNRTVDGALSKQRGGAPVKPAANHPLRVVARQAAALAKVRKEARERRKSDAGEGSPPLPSQGHPHQRCYYLEPDISALL